jgi:hypothetical protein
MKTQAQVVQYTVRGVPKEVDRALRRKAARRKQSLNQLLIDELTMAAVGRKPQADFSDLAGQWSADKAFDEILSTQRKIDPDQWK